MNKPTVLVIGPHAVTHSSSTMTRLTLTSHNFERLSLNETKRAFPFRLGQLVCVGRGVCRWRRYSVGLTPWRRLKAVLRAKGLP